MVEKEEIRSQIIDTARKIFSKYGFRKTTMEEIAQGIGKGKSSIYYYYPGKEEIYRAVIEKEAEILRDTIFKAISKTDDPIEKFRIYVTVRMKTLRDMVNFYEAIKSELLSNLDFINKAREKYDNDEIEMLEGFLREGVKQNLFKIEETNLTAIAIVTAMKGLEVPLFKTSYFKNYEEHINHLIEVIFYGIVKR
jgi:AcrR family transcriptional regulator